MSLRALIHTTEPGRICEIRESGNEFEVHPNFIWVDVPDGTNTADTYNEDGSITNLILLPNQDLLKMLIK